MKRHSRWLRVDAGAEIVTGRPYRVEYAGEYAEEDVATKVLEVPRSSKGTWFVDGDWKSPLVLPTEPTWGIVLSKQPDRHDGHAFDFGRWAVYGDEEWSPLERTHRSEFDTPCDVLSPAYIADFIPLTDEQVARIEAAQ